MAKIIAITNQKGGVGKTTTAVNLAAKLTMMGKKVLLIDTDGQCNSTDTCRAQVKHVATLYDLLFEQESVQECIQHTKVADVIAADDLLNDAEHKFPNDGSRNFILKEALEEVKECYDYIFIDTPPNLGCMLTNAMTCADELIIPVTCDRYGMQGIHNLYQTIMAAKKYTNRELQVAGILLIKYKANTILCREISEKLPEVAAMFDTKVFHTKISESEACKQAQSAKMSVFEYAPHCSTSRNYSTLVREMVGEE